MKTLTRRNFVRLAAASATVAALPLLAQPSAKRKMTMALVGGAIGVNVRSQTALIALAHQHGFESVEARGEELAKLSAGQIEALQSDMQSKGITWAAAGLPVDFRTDEDHFTSGMKDFPPIAAGLSRAGVTRLSTWVTPSSATITYLQNFKQHARRLRQVATVLKDNGIRFGLEYVGTKTSVASRKYPFVHTMAEMKDLIAEIGTGNVGFVLDSWHWWQADDTAADILTLKNSDVVSVDLNDAPAGLAKDQQLDNRRELPCATGVIDASAFLNALNKIGYDGPVRAEPFNKPLNDLDNDPACAATIAALKKAFALIQ